MFEPFTRYEVITRDSVWLTHLQIMNIEMNCVGLVEGNVNQKSKKKHKGSSVIRLTRCWFDCCGQLDQTLSAGFDVNGQ